MSALPEQEFCIECGKLVDYLLPNTGWCADCSGVPPEGEIAKLVCVRCKRAFESNSREFICRYCKEHELANEIERMMVKTELPYSKAKQLVAKDNQAVCLCCGEVIPHALRGRHLFCRVHQRCRSASRRVKHLRMDKGLNKTQALQQVLRELEAERNLT